MIKSSDPRHWHDKFEMTLEERITGEIKRKIETLETENARLRGQLQYHVAMTETFRRQLDETIGMHRRRESFLFTALNNLAVAPDLVKTEDEVDVYAEKRFERQNAHPISDLLKLKKPSDDLPFGRGFKNG